MIKFRQKNFGLPVAALVNTAMIGGTALSLKQGADQQKQAERQQEEALAAQRRENAKLVKALDRVSKEASNNPQAAQQAAELVRKNKTFGVPAGFGKAATGFFKNAKGFVKEAVGAVGSGGYKKVKVDSGKKVVDVFGRRGKAGKAVTTHKYVNEKQSTGIGKIGKTLIGLGTGGALMSGAGYVADKAITADARKIGMMPKKNSSNSVAQPNPVQQKAYGIPAGASSTLSKMGTYAKKGIKYTFSKKNLNKGSIGMAALFGGMPAIGYLSSRAQFKDQQKNQQAQASPNTTAAPTQKAYGVPAGAAKSVMGTIGKTLKKPFRNWDGMKTITGGAAKFTSFGNYGKREIQAYGQRLASGNNKWAKATGNWIKNNPNKANLAGAGIGAVAVSGAWSGGEKLTRKALNKVDKDAYAYEKFQNQEVK